MNPLAPKTYRVIKLLLEKQGQAQRELERSAPASHAQVSKVLAWLERRKYIEWSDGGYRVLSPPSLLSLIALTRNVEEAKVASHFLSLPPTKVVQRLPASAVLCLESALPAYSQYYRSPRVCAYLDPPTKLSNELVRHQGHVSELLILEEDLPLKHDTVTWRGHRITDKVRTLIDLACDGKLYAGKDILRSLYGIEVE